jgi:hypothetical protein
MFDTNRHIIKSKVFTHIGLFPGINWYMFTRWRKEKRGAAFIHLGDQTFSFLVIELDRTFSN